MGYHELNSTFEHEGKVLKVVEADTSVIGFPALCKGCYFLESIDCALFACNYISRPDDKDVVFIEQK